MPYPIDSYKASHESPWGAICPPRERRRRASARAQVHQLQLDAARDRSAPVAAARLAAAGALVCAVLALLSGRRRSGAAGARSRVGWRRSSPWQPMAATFLAALGLVFGRLVPLPEDERVLRAWPAGLFTVGALRVSFGLFLDPLAAVMVLLISGLGALIHLYAAAYMRDDPARPRFFAFLNLFVAAMLLLVLGDGFVPLFFGWEGVGACSVLPHRVLAPAAGRRGGRHEGLPRQPGGRRRVSAGDRPVAVGHGERGRAAG